MLSFCEPFPDAFQAQWGAALAEARIPVGGWSVVPLAGGRDLGRDMRTGAVGACPQLLRLSPFLKICEEEASCGSRASFQCCGHLQPEGPHFITVDTCILTKIWDPAAVADRGSSGPRCICGSSRRLCWWQSFHSFC